MCFLLWDHTLLCTFCLILPAKCWLCPCCCYCCLLSYLYPTDRFWLNSLHQKAVDLCSRHLPFELERVKKQNPLMLENIWSLGTLAHFFRNSRSNRSWIKTSCQAAPNLPASWCKLNRSLYILVEIQLSYVRIKSQFKTTIPMWFPPSMRVLR